MKRLVILNLVFALLATLSEAAPNSLCRTKTWTKSPNASLRTIKIALDKMPRADVVQLALGEMLKKDQSKSIALPTLKYLSGTENKKELRGYYKAMAMVMTKGKLLAQAIERWPTRAPASRSRYTLDQLCQMYQQAKGD